jgi:DNA-binding PadR family transcriptional regulator
MFRHHHHRDHHEGHRGPHRGFGERGGFGGRGWGGERHGRHRVFDQGDLRLVLLQFIADKPSHGYELIKAIEERFGGGYSPSPGVVYPTLTLLEEMGFATVQPEAGGKKLYAATDEGRAELEKNRATLNAIGERMNEARSRGGRFSPQIMRAMENLKVALRYRLGSGDLDEADVSAIAAALDAAALAVEQAGRKPQEG